MKTLSEKKLKLVRACFSCREPQMIEVFQKDLEAWQKGKTIQQAIPYVSADKRELLISGVCGKCFNEMFRES